MGEAAFDEVSFTKAAPVGFGLHLDLPTPALILLQILSEYLHVLGPEETLMTSKTECCPSRVYVLWGTEAETPK